MFFSYADQVSVGDEVLTKRNDKLTKVRVTQVQDVTLQGLYLCSDFEMSGKNS